MHGWALLGLVKIKAGHLARDTAQLGTLGQACDGLAVVAVAPMHVEVLGEARGDKS